MEENIVPVEHLSKWLTLYRESPKIQTDIGGIESDDGNSQTMCWLSFKRPNGVETRVMLTAKSTKPFPSIVAKLFEGLPTDLGDQPGKWADEQTGGAPRKRSSGISMMHPLPNSTETIVTPEKADITNFNDISNESTIPIVSISEKKSSRTRILITNGNKIIELFFITRDGDDIYYGMPHDIQKWSYHATGKQHLKGLRGVKRNENISLPLKKIKGYCHLITTGITPKLLFERAKEEELFSGKKSEHVIYIDSRVIPMDAIVNVSIGILEAGKFEKIPLIKAPNMLDQQVTLITEEEPWICIRIAWPSK